MTASSTLAKNTAATCRTAAAATPPPAASAAASAGSSALLSRLISVTVSRPSPIKAFRSPAAIAVIHKAPTAPLYRLSVSRPSGAADSTTPRRITPAMMAAAARTPEKSSSFHSASASRISVSSPESSPKPSPASPLTSDTASGAASVSSAGSSAAVACPVRQSASRRKKITFRMARPPRRLEAALSFLLFPQRKRMKKSLRAPDASVGTGLPQDSGTVL